jgi:hypothetical protein
MTTRRLTAALATLAVTIALGACGSDDKPAYCSDIDNFKDSFSGLSKVQLTKDGISQLRTSVSDVQSTGQQLISSTKSEFPTQSSALSASVTALTATVKQLGDTASQSAALRALPAELVALKSAYDGLSNAVKDKCD